MEEGKCVEEEKCVYCSCMPRAYCTAGATHYSSALYCPVLQEQHITVLHCIVLYCRVTRPTWKMKNFETVPKSIWDMDTMPVNLGAFVRMPYYEIQAGPCVL